MNITIIVRVIGSISNYEFDMIAAFWLNMLALQHSKPGMCALLLNG